MSTSVNDLPDIGHERGSLNIRKEILLAQERKGLNVSETARELGITRPTYYTWCGKYQAVPPTPKYAREIARFIDRPYEEVLEALLTEQAAQELSSADYDVQVIVRRHRPSRPPRTEGANGILDDYSDAELFRGSSGRWCHASSPQAAVRHGVTLRAHSPTSCRAWRTWRPSPQNNGYGHIRTTR